MRKVVEQGKKCLTWNKALLRKVVDEKCLTWNKALLRKVVDEKSLTWNKALLRKVVEKNVSRGTGHC